jgi:predicted metal-binding protein
MKKNFIKYVKKAKDLGAKETKIIPASSIVTAQWVRLKCQFGCDGYGHRLTCPPFSPTPEQTRRMLKEYTHVLLIHGDAHTDIRTIVAALEREIFLDGFYKAFAMGAGPCYLCPKCGKFCKHPETARPSMEASGIDVYATARGNGFPLDVAKTRACPENYYGIVLLE